MKKSTGKQMLKRAAAIACSIVLLMPQAAWNIAAAELAEDMAAGTKNAPVIAENVTEDVQPAALEAGQEEITAGESAEITDAGTDFVPEEAENSSENAAAEASEAEDAGATVPEETAKEQNEAEAAADEADLPEAENASAASDEASDLIDEEVTLDGEETDNEAKNAEANAYKTFSLNGEETVQFELNPGETGVYEFAFPGTEKTYSSASYSLYSGEGELVPGAKVYYDYNDNIRYYASFMMEAGKSYTLTIRTEGFVGDLLLNRLEEDPFTVEGTTLTDIALNNVDYLVLPEGITDISSSGYTDIMQGCRINGSIMFPSTISRINAYSLSTSMGAESMLFNFYVAGGNEIYSSKDGVLFTDTGETLFKVPCQKAAYSTYLVPGNPTTIGERAFLYSDVSEVILPDSVEIIEASAFSYAQELTSITLGSKVKSIGSYAFDGTRIKQINFPDSLEEIGASPFTPSHWQSSNYNDCQLTSVVLPPALKKIGSGAFRGLKQTSIELPETLMEIEYEAFMNSSLTEIDLPESLEYVGSNAFAGCEDLKKITIFTNADICNVFDGTDSLEQIVVAATATAYRTTEEGWLCRTGEYGTSLEYVPKDYEAETFSTRGFSSVDERVYDHLKGVKHLVLGPEIKEIPDDFIFPELETITVDEGNPKYYAVDNMLFARGSGGYSDTVYLICYPSCAEAESITIPDEVTRIEDKAFRNYSSTPRKLQSVTIPGNTNMGSDIFSTEDETVTEPVLTICGYPGFMGNTNTDYYTPDDAYEYFEEYKDSENLAWTYAPDAYTSDYMTAFAWPDSAAYTGEAILPELYVFFGDQRLTEGVDYTKTVRNNVNPGYAYYNITGIGAFSGTLWTSFQINYEGSQTVTSVSQLQSPHDYPNNSDYTFIFTPSGTAAKSLDVTFDSACELESGYDFVYVLDKNDNEVGKYTGTELSGITVNVPGKTVKVRITSDSSQARWGFRVIKVVKRIDTAAILKTAANVDGGVKLTWNAASGASKYVVYRKKGSGAWTKLATTTAKTYTDTKAAAGTTYRYQIRWIDASGLECISTEEAEGKAIRYLAKVVPTCSNLAGGIKLKWTAATGATGYKIYRKPASGSYKLLTTTKNLTYTDTSVKTKDGTSYVYAVRAYYSSNLSVTSGVTFVRLSSMTISSAANTAAGTMTVKWTKNTKATGYQIQYSTSSSFASGNKTVTVTKNSTVSKVIGSLKKGKTYYVRIRKYKTVSGKKYYSAWSAKKSVKITK